MRSFRQAACDGDIEILVGLHKENPSGNINEAGPESKKTALHWGAAAAHENIIKYLLKIGASVDPLDKDQNTPLNLVLLAKDVSLNKRLTVISQLLVKDADPTLANKDGKTPLMNMLPIRDQVGSNPHQREYVRKIIQQMKLRVIEKARQLNQHAAIRSNGEVVFAELDTLVNDSRNFSNLQGAFITPQAYAPSMRP